METQESKEGIQEETMSVEDEWSKAFDDLYADEDDGEEETSGTDEQAEDGAQTDDADDAGESDKSAGTDTGENAAESQASADESSDSAEAESEEETQEEGDRQNELAERAKNILAQIQRIDPGVKTFNDLEDTALFAALLDRGYTPEDALRQSSPKLRRKESAAVVAASKAHMMSISEDKRNDDVDMSAINQFRAANPGMTKKDAIALYRRVMGK